MDKYDAYASKGILKMDPTPLPSQKVRNGSNLTMFFPEGSTTPPIYRVEVTSDKFLEFMKSDAFKNKNRFYHFVIDDEVDVTTRDEFILRYQFLEYLKGFPNAIFNFCLSDTALPAYIMFLNDMNWNHENRTLFQLSMDHHPGRRKTIDLPSARGRIVMDEEQLIWYSDHTLQLIRNKVDPIIMSDTMKLKNIIHNYRGQLDQYYHADRFNEYDHAYAAYHYLFNDGSTRPIALPTQRIRYANGRVTEMGGVSRLNPSLTRWESKPVGTWEHRKGVCTGQSRLYSALICNPEIGIEASPIFGDIPTGEKHCWVEMNIDGVNYQCCCTALGVFANLERAGYVPLDSQYFAKANDHAFLRFQEQEAIKQRIKSYRR